MNPHLHSFKARKFEPKEVRAREINFRKERMLVGGRMRETKSRRGKEGI